KANGANKTHRDDGAAHFGFAPPALALKESKLPPSNFVPGEHKPAALGFDLNGRIKDQRERNKGKEDDKPGTPAGPAPIDGPRSDKPVVPPEALPDPAAPRKVIIRTGDIEFEIESFDAAVVSVNKLIGSIKNGYVVTKNGERQANGKVKGSVVVRMPPEALDGFIADLVRELGKVGELRSQRIGSQDVTRQYVDLEGRLKSARTMEQRLLQIIKDGKGEIKQLLDAEVQLGVTRTKI